MGYRKIVHKLNAENITTLEGKKWGCNNVYSVLKRHKEREDRLEFINREYELVWSKMEVRLSCYLAQRLQTFFKIFSFTVLGAG